MLTEAALLVADNGSGVGREQIRPICGHGRSSKDPSKSAGHKELGLKSVGEITTEPQIVSLDIAFEFDDDPVDALVESIAGA